MATSALNPVLTSPLIQRVFSRGDFIPLREDILWKIERGAVRTLTWNDQGTQIALGYWGSKDIVGYPLTKVNPYQIQCLTSVEVSILPSQMWHQAVDSMCLHIQRTEELLSIVHRKPVSLRLWQFLVWLSEKFGREVDRGRLIDLAITHQEISEVINTTRVSVTRLLQMFEQQGMMLRHQRRIILHLPIVKLE